MPDVGAEKTQDTRTEQIIRVDQGDAITLLDQGSQARKQTRLGARRQDQMLLGIQRQIEEVADGTGKHVEHFAVAAIAGIGQRTVAGGTGKLLGGPWRRRETHGVEMRGVEKVGRRLRKQRNVRAPRTRSSNRSALRQFKALQARGSLPVFQHVRLWHLCPSFLMVMNLGRNAVVRELQRTHE